MVDCGLCSNTRKVIAEGIEEQCPLCDELIWIERGKQDELEKHQRQQEQTQIQNKHVSHRRTVGNQKSRNRKKKPRDCARRKHA